jgi:uncharacterized protein (UPF0210 family)
MKIRSVTYFDDPGIPLGDDFLSRTGNFARETRRCFEAAGLELQTVRFASPPFPILLASQTDDQIIEFAIHLEKVLIDNGFDYISLGPALPEKPESFSIVPELIRNTEITFCSGLMTHPEKGLSLAAVRACGEIICQLAPLDENGFKNLYFAALGNVPAGGPFFPAAYHDGSRAKFSIAVEAADLAVEAFANSKSFVDARDQLISLIEKHGINIGAVSHDLARITRAQFSGIDYSLAPYPDDTLSIGKALEDTGVNTIGNHGSLAAAAFLADTLDRADFPRSGFSGLMLPVLEDSILADRAAGGKLDIKDMLLFSSVCGTGLDTIPLPGDATPEQISAVLFDLGALSLRLDKPLTARLMPIPGKKAGEPTSFDFPFFANSKVLDLQADALSNFFMGDGYLDLRSRK